MDCSHELVVKHAEPLDPSRGQETPDRGSTGKGEGTGEGFEDVALNLANLAMLPPGALKHQVCGIWSTRQSCFQCGYHSVPLALVYLVSELSQKKRKAKCRQFLCIHIHLPSAA